MKPPAGSKHEGLYPLIIGSYDCEQVLMQAKVVAIPVTYNVPACPGTPMLILTAPDATAPVISVAIWTAAPKCES
jgi:hypothetical protein